MPVGYVRRIGTSTLIALALASSVTTAGMAQGSSPAAPTAASPDPSPVAGTSGSDARADLWTLMGGKVTRLDGETGAVISRTDLAGLTCPIDDTTTMVLQPVTSGVWLTMPFRANSAGGPCAIFVSADGASPVEYQLPLPDPAKVFYRDGVATDEGLWFVGYRARKDGSSSDEDASLYGFDPTTGSVTTIKGVFGIAALDHRLAVTFLTKKGDRVRVFAGTIEPGSDAATRMPGVKELTMGEGVLGAGDLVLFASLFGDQEVLRGVDLSTEATFAIRQPRQLARPRQPRVSPDGVWLQGERKDRSPSLWFAAWDTQKPAAVDDPCHASASDPTSCIAYWVAATPGAGWIASGPWGDDGWIDWERASLTRIDASTLAPTVAGITLSGDPMAPPPSATPAAVAGEGACAAQPGAPADPSPSPGLCARDLIAAATASDLSRKAALSASGEDFRGSGCVKPAGGVTTDLALLCLWEIAYSWRNAQREHDQGGRVTQEAFDQIVPRLRWAMATLDEAGQEYVQQGLLRLDDLPPGWVRTPPGDLKSLSVLKKARIGSVDSKRLHRLLRMAWLENDMVPIPDPLVVMRGGWEQADLPAGFGGVGDAVDFMSFYVPPEGGRSAVTTALSKCELALSLARKGELSDSIRTETCAVAASKIWLAYLATGDDRFIDVARGIQSLALRAERLSGQASQKAGASRLYFDTLECWLDVDSDGCYSGA